MIKIGEVILVEGKYDKTKLESIVDGLIIPVHGFNIFTDKPLRELILKLAEARGVIIMMDSDGAGFKIRGFLHGIIPAHQRIDLYTPDVFGKERRKSTPSKEGKLGVEGMNIKVLRESLLTVTKNQKKSDGPKEPITKMDFVQYNLVGGENSRERRQALYTALDIPVRISTNNAIKLLNAMITRDEFIIAVRKI